MNLMIFVFRFIFGWLLFGVYPNPIRTGLFRTLPGPGGGGGHSCPWAITHDRHMLETSNLVASNKGSGKIMLKKTMVDMVTL